MTLFLTKTSIDRLPLFFVLAGRQRDGHFISWMKDNVMVKSSFACGRIDICFQIVLHRKIKEPKKEENDAKFGDKIPISPQEKNQTLKVSK